MEKKVTTLCMIHQHPRVLLGMKKRGFGAGRWNGFGGKVLPDETIEASAIREMQEETGIVVHDMEQVGFLNFAFTHTPETIDVHIFRIEDFSGEPIESEEMRPQWFYIDEIPFTDMWPDDIYWYPLFLKGKKFKGNFLFEGHDKMLKQMLVEVGEI